MFPLQRAKRRSAPTTPSDRAREGRAWGLPYTSLPSRLKAGIKWASGLSFDRVRVHYNSPEPVKADARAYARGSQIHLARGQERHLPHEAWHLVQQAQRRVKPTIRTGGGQAVNDDRSLEREASLMGSRLRSSQATAADAGRPEPGIASQGKAAPVIQRVYLFDGTTISHQPGPAPAGYLYTGRHNGSKGVDDLYQHQSVAGSAANPFFASQGYGKAPLAPSDVAMQDESPEVSVKDSNAFHEAKNTAANQS